MATHEATIVWEQGDEPQRALLETLHHEAHERCFIASSVTTEVVTEIVS